MTLIDVVVGTGIMLAIFVSLFGAFTLAVELMASTKARAGGVSVVASTLERLRTVPYDELGTLGGIPAGALPQRSTTVHNGTLYTVRTLIQYVDDPADGIGAADSNGVSADYKRIKVEASWTVRGKGGVTSAVTLAAPRGVESLVGGGTLRLTVFDALARPVSGARVSVRNQSLTPAVALEVFSDAEGTVVFPGAPQSASYGITVEKDGYSSAGTYDASPTNPNPNPARVSVVQSQTTSASFAIDRLGTLALRAVSPRAELSFSDSFDTAEALEATSSVTVIQGSLVLAQSASSTVRSGDARSVFITPAALSAWRSFEFESAEPAGTLARVQVVVPVGSGAQPISNAVLPGNQDGFSQGVIDLSALSTSTYPSLALRALLTSDSPSVTSTIDSWRVRYAAGPFPLAALPLTIQSAKSIGTTGAGVPVPKLARAVTTNAAGTFEDLFEWDAYALLPPATHDIAELCPSATVIPAERTDVALTLVPASSHSLRVEVRAGGVPLPLAVVTLGTLPSVGTSECGQAFFTGLSATSYPLTVTKPGYQSVSQSVQVTGRATAQVFMSTQ